MIVQANISRVDLGSFLDELMPLVIELSADDFPLREVHIQRPERTELVAGRGLRIFTHLVLHGVTGGVRAPIAGSSAQILLTPSIGARDGHEVLAFSFRLESIDLPHVPGVLDEKVLERINRAFVKDDARLSWDFARTLAFGFSMPRSMRSVKRVTLRAQEGGVRVTEEGFSMAVFFETEVSRTSALPSSPEIMARSEIASS
ncbi:MAG: hypothetical protein ACLQVI_41450 [Polyangiaceae bacterium]|jgi:hypothetical protein